MSATQYPLPTDVACTRFALGWITIEGSKPRYWKKAARMPYGTCHSDHCAKSGVQLLPSNTQMTITPYDDFTCCRDIEWDLMRHRLGSLGKGLPPPINLCFRQQNHL